jgi:hypothetical protein
MTEMKPAIAIVAAMLATAASAQTTNEYIAAKGLGRQIMWSAFRLFTGATHPGHMRTLSDDDVQGLNMRIIRTADPCVFEFKHPGMARPGSIDIRTYHAAYRVVRGDETGMVVFWRTEPDGKVIPAPFLDFRPLSHVAAQLEGMRYLREFCPAETPVPVGWVWEQSFVDWRASGGHLR